MISYASPLRSTNSQRESDFCADRACRRLAFEQCNSAFRRFDDAVAALAD
jgi:hypothetical protein